MLSLRVSSDVDVTIDQENYISSSVQCKSLSVWSVTFTLTHFLSKTIFSRGYGGVQNSNGNSEGVGGYFSGQNMEIPRRRGGLREIPSMVGVWIFSGTTHCSCLPNK